MDDDCRKIIRTRIDQVQVGDQFYGWNSDNASAEALPYVVKSVGTDEGGLVVIWDRTHHDGSHSDSVGHYRDPGSRLWVKRDPPVIEEDPLP